VGVIRGVYTSGVYSSYLSFLIPTTKRNNHALLSSCSLSQETSLLPVSFNIYVNSPGTITDSTLVKEPAPQLPPSAPQGRKQPDKRWQEWKKEKFWQAWTVVGFLFPPAQVVCSLLVKFTVQASNRLSFVAKHVRFYIPKVLKFSLHPAGAIHWDFITTTLLLQLLLLRIFTMIW